MNAFLFSSLALHLAACSLLTGASFLLVLAGPARDEAAAKWEQRVLACSKWLVLVSLGSGLVWFALRAATFTEQTATALDPSAIFSAAIGTWAGKIWLVRQSLLVLAAAYLFLAGNSANRADWLASRWLILILSATALVLMSLSSHAAAVLRQPLAHWADLLHLLSAGLWVGALPFLALLLFTANKGGDALAPFSLRALKRFSRVATFLIFALAGTGLVTARYLVGDVAGLVGTTHGRLLIAKIMTLVAALLIAARIRELLAASRSELPLARRIGVHIAVEAALVLVILGFAVAMILSVPGKHVSPTWPFSLRYVLDQDVAGLWPPLSQSQNALLLAGMGLLVLGVIVRLWRHQRILWAGTAMIAVVMMITAAFVGTIVAAYPTSYARSPVPYDVRALQRGQEISRSLCHDCPETMSVGDYFWLAGEDKDEEDRWRLAQFLWTGSKAAAHSPKEAEKALRPGRLPAPDFDIVLGPLQLGTLHDHRKGRAVLLVLYTLPLSRERMEQLAQNYARLAVYNVEIVAVQRDTSANPIAELKTSSPALFPIVTEGNEMIAAAYDLFSPGTAHAEFLIDTRGFIRAIWRDDEWNAEPGDSLEAHAKRLLEEKTPDIENTHFH